ncbi:MAG: YitT family protein, partial [Chloroflexi bacterium]
RILTDLKRGVTAMQGKGMYTGNVHSVLMCALTVTEVHNLKSAVAKEDPKAVVIVSPAQEVLGGGFAPLEG